MASIAKFLLKCNTTNNVLKTSCRKALGGPISPVACKVAVITGGSIGIGYNLANAILLCGGKAVVLGDVRCKEGEEAVCRLNQKHGENRACFVKTDVTKQDEMDKLFCTAKDIHKRVDLVINNAGVLNDKCWEEEMAINAAGVVRGTLLGFEHMRSDKGARGGIIVNIASIHGLEESFASPVYTATKHFVIGFGRAFSNQYYECMTQVKVFTMCPGVTETNLLEEACNGGIEGFGDTGKLLKSDLLCLPSQPPEICGRCLMRMLCDGENGGIWVIEDSDCYKIKFPNRKTLRVGNEQCCP